MKKLCKLIIMCILTVLSVNAQENIVIGTNQTQIVLRVNKDKELKFEYYGKKLANLNDLFKSQVNLNSDAYPAFGLKPDRTIAIRAKHFDGDLSLVFKYQSHDVKKISDNTDLITIHLKDENYPFYVDLKYKTFEAEDVVEVWSEIFHDEKKSVILYDYASSYLTFNAPAPCISHFHGSWATEFTMEETMLNKGTFSIESTEGIRNSLKDNASFLLSLNGKSSEDDGEVIAGSLAWTGNYKISFSHDMNAQLYITAGINAYASDYTLDKGKKFITPAMILTYSDKGKGLASRNLHRYARSYKMVGGHELRKILLNSWEGVYFTFDQQKIVELIDGIAKIGGELFVLDDGWFGNKYPRNSDSQGLGDWQVCEKKLPDGINYLVNESEKRGIKFGIWIEPEMVDITSELYEKHPEWVLQNTNRELIKGRGKTQVILDLSNPKVQDFVFNVVDDLMTHNPNIDFIKWDANATITNYGSTYIPKDRQSNLYIDYHLGLQSVFKRLREKYPTLTMQACASGGGRANYGYLQYFNEIWTSDNTDAFQRLRTQWGMSQIFPAQTMAAHVSVSPNHQTKREIPLKFRFDVAMTARLGFELQPKDMTEQELNFTKSAIQVYKNIRPIVQFGDLYRIISPYENERLASLMYVDEKKENAVFFAYYIRKQVREVLPFFKLKGLDPNKLYSISEINTMNGRKIFVGESGKYTGSYLMDTGVKLNLSNEYDSVVLQLKTEN